MYCSLVDAKNSISNRWLWKKLFHRYVENCIIFSTANIPYKIKFLFYNNNIFPKFIWTLFFEPIKNKIKNLLFKNHHRRRMIFQQHSHITAFHIKVGITTKDENIWWTWFNNSREIALTTISKNFFGLKGQIFKSSKVFPRWK